MRLLFDQNLSHFLVSRLASEYPGSVHARDLGLSTADDQDIWDHAAQHGLTIIPKDSDFEQRSLLYNHPPKIVWIRRGSITTLELENLLRLRHGELLAFEADDSASILVLT